MEKEIWKRCYNARIHSCVGAVEDEKVDEEKVERRTTEINKREIGIRVIFLSIYSKGELNESPKFQKVINFCKNATRVNFLYKKPKYI